MTPKQSSPAEMCCVGVGCTRALTHTRGGGGPRSVALLHLAVISQQHDRKSLSAWGPCFSHVTS